MPINDLTSYQQYNYNKADFSTPKNRADNYGNLSNSVNMLYEMGIKDRFTGDFSNVGFYTEMRDPDEDKFMKTMLQLGYARTKLLTQALNNPGLQQYLTGTKNFGPSLTYMPLDNGDQLRKFGFLVADAVRDNGFRTVIKDYTLAAYIDDSGDTGATAIPAPADYNTPTTLYFGPEDSGFFASGCCDCKPGVGNCANGYRQAFIIKKRDYTPNAVTSREMVYILDQEYNPRGNGGYSITIARGQGREGPTDLDENGVYSFESGTPLALEPGDVLLFGQVVPNTQCLPQLCCVHASPKVYSYCSIAQEMIDCLYCDRPSERMVQGKDELPLEVRQSYELYQQLRDILHRTWQTILEGQYTYAGGQRRPIEVLNSSPTVVEYNDCDTIPFTTRGVFPTVESFGQKMSHYFTSCNDTCGQYKIGRIFEIMAEAMQGTNVYDSPGWVFVGDVKPLEQYQASLRSTNVAPNSQPVAQQLQNMEGASFRPDAKSLFGSTFDANAQGMSTLYFADRAVNAIHDSTLAAIYPNTVWFINMSAFEFFAPDLDSLHQRGLGFNPYFSPTGQRGALAPYIYTQSLVPTMVNGQMQYKAERNCGVEFQTYMWLGLHPKAEFLPHMVKFTYGARLENPDFDDQSPEGPDNQRYLYDNISALDCGCASVEQSITSSMTHWNQTV